MNKYEVPMRYTRTLYPKIFKGTYWGTFRPMDENQKIVIKNRNQFVTDYGIKRRVTLIPEYIRNIIHDFDCRLKLIDHLEVYYTHSKQYVIVTSPYIIPERTEDWEEALKHYTQNGFSIYEDLYNFDASTFIKVVNGRANKVRMY